MTCGKQRPVRWHFRLALNIESSATECWLTTKWLCSVLHHLESFLLPFSATCIVWACVTWWQCTHYLCFESICLFFLSSVFDHYLPALVTPCCECFWFSILLDKQLGLQFENRYGWPVVLHHLQHLWCDAMKKQCNLPLGFFSTMLSDLLFWLDCRHVLSQFAFALEWSITELQQSQ